MMDRIKSTPNCQHNTDCNNNNTIVLLYVLHFLLTIIYAYNKGNLKLLLASYLASYNAYIYLFFCLHLRFDELYSTRVYNV